MGEVIKKSIGRKFKLILGCAFMLYVAYFASPLIPTAGIYYNQLVGGLLGLCTIYNTSNVVNKFSRREVDGTNSNGVSQN